MEWGFRARMSEREEGTPVVNKKSLEAEESSLTKSEM
jgi:hypothetical protein